MSAKCFFLSRWLCITSAIVCGVLIVAAVLIGILLAVGVFGPRADDDDNGGKSYGPTATNGPTFANAVGPTRATATTSSITTGSTQAPPPPPPPPPPRISCVGNSGCPCGMACCPDVPGASSGSCSDDCGKVTLQFPLIIMSLS